MEIVVEKKQNKTQLTKNTEQDPWRENVMLGFQRDLSKVGESHN